MSENVADRAKEQSVATIAQPKRIGPWRPTRQVHYPDVLRDALLGGSSLYVSEFISYLRKDQEFILSNRSGRKHQAD